MYFIELSPRTISSVPSRISGNSTMQSSHMTFQE